MSEIISGLPQRKYVKVKLDIWRCSDPRCDFRHAYETVRCPLCGSREQVKVRDGNPNVEANDHSGE